MIICKGRMHGGRKRDMGMFMCKMHIIWGGGKDGMNDSGAM